MIELAVSAFDLDALRVLLNSVGFAHICHLSKEFDYLSELARLGPLVGQFDGAVVRDVRPDPAVGNSTYSPSNTRELLAHTEWFEFPGLPPRFVALWSVRTATGSGGETTLADAYPFIDGLPAELRSTLLSRRYSWGPSVGLAKVGIDYRTKHQLLERVRGELVIRFPCDDRCLDYDDDMNRFIELGRAYFAEHSTAVRILEDSMLIWDNWRVLHARTAFADTNRHLKRVLIADYPTRDSKE
ncbi:TauD/TfdA family dioxygenase [Amycolatopsis eburnea]|uniref:TauD/TfdA family dioxygenase n=1 Tax=Amycolatopsis eburnea TaxID=2267691 RepID=UPI0013150866|nr:TauD/TfdA family dioxygenase [Amycolatopsis eburnea]